MFTNLKSIPCFLVLALAMICIEPVHSQSQDKPVIVIVHGTWGGGWAFKKVDSLLTVKGVEVYRPTMTGQGERNHLASSVIGLNDHILDIINVILYEDLHNVTLVGHSYGGMVITGVADSIPGRIGQLVYLDALLPDNGESVASLMGSQLMTHAKTKDGFLLPWWVPEGAMPPKDVPHSARTWTDPIVLDNTFREKISSFYILTVEKGKNMQDDEFYSQSKRAKEKDWPIVEMTADHNPQWSMPEELAEVLFLITNHLIEVNKPRKDK